MSLISEIVENISTKKVFTKLDLCWDYTVMFFGLTNSLTMFQSINNNKWNSTKLDQYWKSSKLHWWYYSRNRGRERTWQSSREGGEEANVMTLDLAQIAT